VDGAHILIKKHLPATQKQLFLSQAAKREHAKLQDLIFKQLTPDSRFAKAWQNETSFGKTRRKS